MNEKLIKELSEGRAILKNEGTLEELKMVLKLAFPKDAHSVSGASIYYYKGSNSLWGSSCAVDNRAEPIYSVKDFYLPEFEYGEEVEISKNNIDWENKIFISRNPIGINKERNIVVNSYGFVTTWEYIRKIEQPKVLELTIKEIADKFGVDESLIKIKL